MESLSPESKALCELLTAETSEIYEAKFVAYKKEKLDAVEVFGDLCRKCSRVPGRDDAERAKEIVAATATAPALSTPAVSHVFPDPTHGPDLVSSTSSTTRSTRPLRVSSSGITTIGSHELAVATLSSNPAPAAAATGISASAATSAASASWDVVSLVASATTLSASPGGDTGAVPVTAPVASAPAAMRGDADLTAATPIPADVAASAVTVLVPSADTPFVGEGVLHVEASTGAISAPPSTALGEMDPVVVTPVTCSTMGADHNSDGEDPVVRTVTAIVPWPPPSCNCAMATASCTTPWPHFLGMCMNQPMDSSEDEIRLKCKGREHCLIGEILLKVISSKEEIQPTCQVWTILPNDLNGGFSLDNLWDPGGLISGDWHFQHLEESRRHKRSVSVALYGQQAIELFPRNEPGYACAPFEHSIDKVMEMFASPTITCELHYSTLVAESLLSAPYSSWCMRCVKLDMEGPWQCVSFLQPKPPWSNLAEWHRQILEYNGLTCQYGSYKGTPSENATHYVPASFIWYITWLLVGLSCTHLLFGGSRSRIMEITVKIMELQPTKIRWYPLPRAKPPNNYDKCNLLWKMQGISLASSSNLAVVTFKQPCQLQLLNAISSSEVVLLFSFRLLTENQSSLGSHDELHSSTMIWKLHNLLEMIELKPWPSWELFPYLSAVTSLQDASYILSSLVLTLKIIYSKSNHYREVQNLVAIFIMFSTSANLHVRELYWLVGLYCICDWFVAQGATYLGSQLLEWKIPWYFCPCHVVSSGNWLRIQPVGSHCKSHAALFFSWNVNRTIDSEPAIEQVSGMFRIAPHCLEMMPWDIASSHDDIVTYTERVLISWDPGGSDPVVPTACNITQLQFLHLIWDPGGSTRHRLEGKPKFKEGGLSTTCLLSWPVGRDSWAWPALDTGSTTNTREKPHRQFGLERTDGLGR